MIDAESAVWETSGPLPIPPLWRTLREDLAPGFAAFLEETAAVFGECEIMDAERFAVRTWEKEKTALRGKIDLMLRTEDGIVLIDYKTKNVPKPAAIAPENGAASSFQIPCYILLAEREGERAAVASYYSFDNRKYTHVCHPRAGKRYFSPEKMVAVTADTERIILQSADNIRRGDFTGQASGYDHCRDCSLRPVCRRQYHLLVRD